MFAAPALFLQRWGRGRAEAYHGVARNKLLQCLFPPALCTLGPFCVEICRTPNDKHRVSDWDGLERWGGGHACLVHTTSCGMQAHACYTH